MSEVTITVLDHGPVIVRGQFTAVDAEGKEFERQETVALCRCGHSGGKPFCDGTHKTAGFQSAPRAQGASGEAAS